MNDTVETTPEMVQVVTADSTIVPSDGEAAQPEGKVFVAEEQEAVSVPFDA